MNGAITIEKAYHLSNIIEHYAHAKEKHPYFCDGISPFDIGYVQMDQTFEEVVEERRDVVVNHAKTHSLLLEHLMACEYSEVLCECDRGNDAQAVQKLYDLAVLCLRAIDVLEGRQKLGKLRHRRCLSNENVLRGTKNASTTTKTKNKRGKYCRSTSTSTTRRSATQPLRGRACG